MANLSPLSRQTLVTEPSAGYTLLDSGAGEKLERFGDVMLVRPDPQALWDKALPAAAWQKADARYAREGREGEWTAATALPAQWEVAFGGLRLLLRPTSFKHTGLFPEQLPNWDWMRDVLRSRDEQSRARDFPAGKPLSPRAVALGSPLPLVSAPFRMLNLFGYTGGATLAAAAAGAEVVHVDASRVAVAWARENAARSGLADAPVRWVVEDALTFVKREEKRGRRYDGIIMDPPAFGRGPSGEVWKIEEDFIELVARCRGLLSDEPSFFLINGYAAGYSPLAFAYNLEPLAAAHGGAVACGDLTIRQGEQAGDPAARLLPCGIFARWSREGSV